jgi:hypothetical protein
MQKETKAKAPDGDVILYENLIDLDLRSGVKKVFFAVRENA